MWHEKENVFCVAIAFVMTPMRSQAAEADTHYFCDENGTRVEMPEEVVNVEAGMTIWNGSEKDAWIVVSKDVTLSARVEVQGDVVLILSDDATLTATKGIHVSGDNSLTIYGQAQSDGKLYIKGCTEYQAAIGGNQHESAGNITVNGAVLEVYGGKNGAGIGGGQGGVGTGSAITINQGKVYAKGGDAAAGIGGGMYAFGTQDSGCIRINGGEVTAESVHQGAGLGGGQAATGGNIEINGGKVKACGSSGASGIGSGYGSYVTGKIYNGIQITGGCIHAEGGWSLCVNQ